MEVSTQSNSAFLSRGPPKNAPMPEVDPDEAAQQCEQTSLLDLLTVGPVRLRTLEKLYIDGRTQLYQTSKSIRKEVGCPSCWQKFCDLV
jgi:hypothetical protein